MSQHTDEAAFQKITAAKYKMVSRQPFFASIALFLPFIEAPWLNPPTMATDMQNIYYHPQFVHDCSQHELIGVIAHETCHVAFLHGTRRGDREPRLWNIACVSEGTMVTMADGSLLPIEAVKGGMMVYTPKGDGRVVMKTMAKKKLVELVADNGYKLLCGEEHKVLTEHGFIEAGKITKGTACVVDRRFAATDHYDGIDALHDRDRGSRRSVVSPSGQFSVSQWPVFPAEMAWEGEAIRHIPSFNNGTGVFGGDSGRGRNDLNRSEYREREGVLPATRNDIEYQPFAGELAGSERLQRNARKELEWQGVLEMHGIRIEGGTVVDCDPAFFGDQETTRRKMFALHAFADGVTEDLANFGRNADAVSGHQDLEYSRINSVVRHEGNYTVYDLVTTGHSFTANGIVTHNCDYAINPIILDAGMKLPGFGLYEDKYRNMTAQAIYADLQKNQDAIKKILDKMPIFQIGGDGQGQGDGSNPGNGEGIIHGGIIDTSQFKDADGRQISATEIEHAIKMKVAGAAQSAKSIGKMPGGFEGLLEAVGKPVINWHEYIQAWVKGHTPDDFTWARPNRRMLANHRVYMPSMVLRGAGTGVLSIDTSGSVSDQELIRYITEIVGVIEMCKPDRLIIIQHDAIIQKIDEWDMSMDFSSLKVKGRGGTCIAPVFKHLSDIDDEIDWMICFTDMGINDYPPADKAPEYPVLWAATGPDNAPFGTYIPVKDAMDG